MAPFSASAYSLSLADVLLIDPSCSNQQRLFLNFHNLSRYALAGFQFDLDFQGFRLSSQLRPLNGVPGDWRRRKINRFGARRGARNQPVFARRDVVQRERAVGSDNRLGVAKNVVRRRNLSRDQM